MQSYLESVSRAPDDYPTEADLASAYERAKPQLAQPALYRVSQIFLPAPLRRRGRGRRAQAGAGTGQAGPGAQGRFRRAGARQFAGCQQPRTGRRHRLLPLAQLTPEMRPAVEQLKTGDVSAPVQSAAGFHILKLADLRPASVTPFDQVKGELRAALRSQRQELAARAYLEGLLNAGTVSIDGAALNAAFEQTAAARRPAAPSRAPSPEAPEPVPALARRLDDRLLQALGQADPPVSVQSAAALIQALRATFPTRCADGSRWCRKPSRAARGGGARGQPGPGRSARALSRAAGRVAGRAGLRRARAGAPLAVPAQASPARPVPLLLCQYGRYAAMIEQWLVNIDEGNGP